MRPARERGVVAIEFVIVTAIGLGMVATLVGFAVDLVEQFVQVAVRVESALAQIQATLDSAGCT